MNVRWIISPQNFSMLPPFANSKTYSAFKLFSSKVSYFMWKVLQVLCKFSWISSKMCTDGKWWILWLNKILIIELFRSNFSSIVMMGEQKVPNILTFFVYHIKSNLYIHLHISIFSENVWESMGWSRLCGSPSWKWCIFCDNKCCHYA